MQHVPTSEKDHVPPPHAFSRTSVVLHDLLLLLDLSLCMSTNLIDLRTSESKSQQKGRAFGFVSEMHGCVNQRRETWKCGSKRLFKSAAHYRRQRRSSTRFHSHSFLMTPVRPGPLTASFVRPSRQRPLAPKTPHLDNTTDIRVSSSAYSFDVEPDFEQRVARSLR